MAVDTPIAAGYVRPGTYLTQNERRNAEDPQRKFSLGFALELWRDAVPRNLLPDRIGPSPRCLIEGSASAGNVDALIGFLRHQGIDAPDIHVIDLIDLEAMGHGHRTARFHHADACDLSGLFADGSFDLVLQDHLLNCAPVVAYPAILAELKRILRPGGMVLLHYTDPGDFPPAEGDALRDRLGLAGGVHSLGLSPGERETLAGLPPARRLVATGEGFVMVTLPLGNLEHFVPFETLEGLLDDAGLAVRQHSTVRVTDAEGLACRRHHCLVETRAPR